MTMQTEKFLDNFWVCFKQDGVMFLYLNNNWVFIVLMLIYCINRCPFSKFSVHNNHTLTNISLYALIT